MQRAVPSSATPLGWLSNNRLPQIDDDASAEASHCELRADPSGVVNCQLGLWSRLVRRRPTWPRPLAARRTPTRPPPRTGRPPQTEAFGIPCSLGAWGGY